MQIAEEESRDKNVPLTATEERQASNLKELTAKSIPETVQNVSVASIPAKEKTVERQSKLCSANSKGTDKNSSDMNEATTKCAQKNKDMVTNTASLIDLTNNTAEVAPTIEKVKVKEKHPAKSGIHQLGRYLEIDSKPAQDKETEDAEKKLKRDEKQGETGNRISDDQKRIQSSFVIPSDIEEIIKLAVSLVTAELKTGSWIVSNEGEKISENTKLEKSKSTSIISQDAKIPTANPHKDTVEESKAKQSATLQLDKQKLNPKPSQRIESSETPKNKKLTEKEEKTSRRRFYPAKFITETQGALHCAACAIEKFGLEILLPTFRSAGVGDQGSAENPRRSSQRVLVALFLALREVMAMNASTFFFISTTYERKEQDDFVAQILSTSLILSAIGKLKQPESIELSKQIKDAVQKYDTADDEFTSYLKREDGRSLGVFPNGDVLGKEENIVTRVSFNYAHREHPLIKGQRKRKILENTHSQYPGLRKKVHHMTELPKPTAAYASVIEKVSEDSEAMHTIAEKVEEDRKYLANRGKLKMHRDKLKNIRKKYGFA